jgi:hypothetical protein
MPLSKVGPSLSRFSLAHTGRSVMNLHTEFSRKSDKLSSRSYYFTDGRMWSARTVFFFFKLIKNVCKISPRARSHGYSGHGPVNAWTWYVITRSHRNWLLGHKLFRFVKNARDCYVLTHLLTDSCHAPLAFQSTFACHAEVLVLTGLWAIEYKSFDDVLFENFNLPN